MFSNIGVRFTIAIIKSRYLLGFYFLKMKPIIDGTPDLRLYPPLSKSPDSL